MALSVGQKNKLITYKKKYMEIKTLKRSEIEALGKVVSITKPEKVVDEIVTEKTLTQVPEETLKELVVANEKETIKTNINHKKRMSMKKTVANTEPRVLKFLANRKPKKTMVIAKALGMSSSASERDYKLLANLLIKMHKNGVLKKIKTGVYTLATRQPLPIQTEMTFIKPTEKPYAITQQQRMANMREAKRQKKIERELESKKNNVTFNADEKLLELFRLRREVGRAPSFYSRVDKEIEAIILGVRHKAPSLKTLNNGKLITTNQILSGFRLIKSYPNCPYAIGVVIAGSKDLFNYPEYWQPQYQASEPEITTEQKNLIQEAKEYMQVAMDLIKKAESNG